MEWQAHLRALESAEAAAAQARAAVELAGRRAKAGAEAAAKKLQEVDMDKMKEEISQRARAAADAAAEKVRAFFSFFLLIKINLN